MASTPKLTSTISSSPSLQILCKKLPIAIHLPSSSSSSSSSSFLSLPKTLTSLYSLRPRIAVLSNHRYYHSRRFSVRASTENGADSERHYDFDLFTIGAGSGGVRASRISTSFGASAAVCELPFSTISSDTAGGVGGTCVLRGCVPKKLLVYASKYSHEFEDSHGFGWKYETEPSHDWTTLIANKNAELQRLTGIYKNILSKANVKLIEGRGKVRQKLGVHVVTSMD